MFSIDSNPSGKTTIKKTAWKYLLIIGAIFLLACLTAPAFVLAATPGGGEVSVAPSDTSLGDRFGVASSHLRGYDPGTMEGEFSAMEDVGAAWVRCDFAWFDIEYVKDSWNFTGADLVVQKAEDHGVEVLGILGTSPPWANGGNDWNYPTKDIAAWRTYIRTVATRYAGRVAAWEIWNEENIHAFWMPEPDATDYMVLLAAASEEIRAADPAATIVMGGVAGLGSDYLDACLSLGAAQYVDAIAYHPYAETIGVQGQPEEDLLRPKESLCRALVDFVHGLAAPNDPEIWITEVGWTTTEISPPGVDPDTQASYMLRTLINYASTDVDRVIWYNLRDTLLNDYDHYGLLEFSFVPRPSYHYYSTFADVFGPAVAVDKSTVSFTCSDTSTLEAHCFRLPDGSLAMAAWKSNDAADTLSFTVSDPSFRNPRTIDPLTGASQVTPGVTRSPQGDIGVSGLAIGKTPVILVMDKVAVTSITPNQAYQHTISMNISDIAGSGFQAGASVRLELDGNVINAYNVNVPSLDRITCTVGFFGVAIGTYDVVVTNPDGSRARLEDGFRVLSPCGAGGGTAILCFGLMLGLFSMAGALRMRGSRRSRK